MDPAPDMIRGKERRLLGPLFASQSDAGAESEGDWIGPYRLVQRLGEGGFGIVWRAEQQEPVQRVVALKVIKRGMDTVQVLTRFSYERQALAGMDHPCIAAMLDAGASADGRPWFAMELVKGEPITQWCESRDIPLPERLHLFVQLCQAVQHAHQKGIIHRDLKPSNILVTVIDGKPLPKIIDFGVAKAMDRVSADGLTLHTQADMAVGTPLYMSPEQLDGGQSVDTRSDVYALGVLLFELLTGKLPFDASIIETDGLAGLKRRIRDQEPERPSALMRERERERLASRHAPAMRALPTSGHEFPSDLDWITMRALEKERVRRYQSAADFAGDVQRFLNAEPILARPPSFSYVTGRWIKRHRTVFTAACVVMLALFTGTGVALWQARVARAAELAAEEHALHASQERATAVAEANRAKHTAAFVTKLLDRIAEEVKNGRNPEALRFALADCEKQIRALGSDHALRLELLDRVSQLYLDIGDTKFMLPLLKLRVEEVAALHGEGSDEAVSAEIAYLKQLMDHGARSTAPALVENLLARVESRDGRGSLHWFDVQRVLARAWLKVKEAKKAAAVAEESLAEAEARHITGRTRVSIQLFCIEVISAAGNHERADALLASCREAAIQLRDTKHLDLLENMQVRSLVARENFAGAAAVLREIVHRLKIRPGAESKDIMPALLELVERERQSGQLDQALAHSEEAVKIARAPAASPDLLWSALVPLSRVQRARKDFVASIATANEALAVARKAGKSVGIIKCLQALAESQQDEGLLDAAIETRETFLRVVDDAHANYRDAVDDLVQIVTIRRQQARLDDAMQAAARAWERIEKEPDAASDGNYASDTAATLLHCFDEWRRTNPSAPVPPFVIGARSAIARGPAP